MADRPATTRKKKSGRKRRVTGCLLLAIGVLITGMWWASRWRWFGYGAAYSRIEVGNGLLGISGWDIRPDANTGWFFVTMPLESWNWWISAADTGTSDLKWSAHAGIACYLDYRPRDLRGPLKHVYFVLLLWPFALTSLLTGGWLLWSARRARRRAMTGVCLKCGYDLAGLAAGAPCAECGKSAAVA